METLKTKLRYMYIYLLTYLCMYAFNSSLFMKGKMRHIYIHIIAYTGSWRDVLGSTLAFLLVITFGFSSKLLSLHFYFVWVPICVCVNAYNLLFFFLFCYFLLIQFYSFTLLATSLATIACGCSCCVDLLTLTNLTTLRLKFDLAILKALKGKYCVT